MNIVFHAHSGLRWLVIIGVVLIVIKSIIGLYGNGKYSKFDKILGSATVGFMDIMLILGLILYFGYSSYTKNLTFDMSNAEERFWSVEHLIMMLLAIAFAHIGKVKAGKLVEDKMKYRTQVIFFSASLALMMLAIPWDRV
jgi:hypothetical protein